jgi:hypothetical protein
MLEAGVISGLSFSNLFSPNELSAGLHGSQNRGERAAE